MNVSNENNLSDNESMLDEVLPVSPELVDEIIHALEEGDKEQIDFLLEPLHNADIADVFEQLSDHHRRILTSVIGSEMEPEVLSELDDSTLDDVIVPKVRCCTTCDTEAVPRKVLLSLKDIRCTL